MGDAYKGGYMAIPRQTVRRLMSENQGIGKQPTAVEKEEIYRMVDRLGCVQIDTINVVERAHYLTLWARLGCYDRGMLHDLLYRDRRLFEYWGHAASVIPLKDYRYFIYPMQVRRAKIEERFKRWGKVDPEMLSKVLERIRREGPLAAKDFEYKREGRSQGWWDWKPAKVALEVLFGAGILLVSHRENFQRYYNLGERVLPNWVDTSEPDLEERVRFFAVRTMGCLGLVKPSDLRGYYHHYIIKLGRTSKQLRELLDGLVEVGDAERFKVEGEKQPYYCMAEDADRVKELEDGDFDGVRFLTNFDNLLWLRDRVRALFGFEAKLETYVPREKRRYGYFNLPVLYGDRLVGRIVPKMDRRRQVLIVRSVWHEPWFDPDDVFENAFAETLDSFARFNGADEVEMEEDRPRKG